MSNRKIKHIIRVTELSYQNVGVEDYAPIGKEGNKGKLGGAALPGNIMTGCKEGRRKGIGETYRISRVAWTWAEICNGGKCWCRLCNCRRHSFLRDR